MTDIWLFTNKVPASEDLARCPIMPACAAASSILCGLAIVQRTAKASVAQLVLSHALLLDVPNRDRPYDDASLA